MDKKAPSKFTDMNTLFLLSLLCLSLSSCNTDTQQVEKGISYPNQSIPKDSIISLKGVLNIDSKGAFLFKGINYSDEGRGSATYLIPLDEDLKEYVQSHYDAYLHLRNIEEQFFISIEGKYLTDNLINSTDSTSFLFNFIALMDENDLTDKE
ncbi:MAG: hypothetical protein JKY03_10690 [Aureispira sp.]|nr:hypothetical protein [Aureispira sp.]